MPAWFTFISSSHQRRRLHDFSIGEGLKLFPRDSEQRRRRKFDDEKIFFLPVPRHRRRRYDDVKKSQSSMSKKKREIFRFFFFACSLNANEWYANDEKANLWGIFSFHCQWRLEAQRQRWLWSGWFDIDKTQIMRVERKWASSTTNEMIRRLSARFKGWMRAQRAA